MERLHPVHPESVRIWRGFKNATLARDKFLQKLGNVFIPITAQHQAPAGLTAYLPTVLPAEKPDCLPDEIALVFYASQAAYSRTSKTCSGRAYGLLHGAVFDSSRSKSDFPKLLENPPLPNQPYTLLGQPADWFVGRSRVLAGVRRTTETPEHFRKTVTELLASSLPHPADLDGMYLFYTEDYLLCWEHRPLQHPPAEPSFLDRLAPLVTVILQEYDRPCPVTSDPYAEHPGLTIQGGEHLNIQFNRDFRRTTMAARTLPVYGLHGNAHIAPADTMESYWAALGAGAGGIAAAVQLTTDGVLICCPDTQLIDAGNVAFHLSAHTAAECTQLNAGAAFRSVPLTEDNQPTGDFGRDLPWQGARPNYPRLQEVLQIFGRRTEIMLLITDSADPARLSRLIDQILAMLGAFGLEDRITMIGDRSVCIGCRERSAATPLAYMPTAGEPLQEALECADQAGIHCLYLNRAIISGADIELIKTKGCMFLLTNDGYSLAPADFRDMGILPGLRGLVMRSVDRTRQLVSPPALVLSDDFSGETINRDLWACGYSHCNRDTLIRQSNGLIIEIAEGGDYSGAAAVCRIPVHGDFDAQVDFHVTAPQQATTFELAAITIDPGYHHPANDDLNSRNVNLTFDVHGAPPYASSERDEDNGFRIGWNNSHNLTRIDADWQSDSGNMYNKYSPDVGDGSRNNASGSLRLTRHGSVFTASYRDIDNAEWVCSGSALVHNMSDDVFLRLAAKHWKKGGVPPANRIVFTSFRLYQY